MGVQEVGGLDAGETRAAFACGADGGLVHLEGEGSEGGGLGARVECGGSAERYARTRRVSGGGRL